MSYGYIFAYGSLMNTNSRERTLGRRCVARPCRLHPDAGYRREWCARVRHQTALGLTHSPVGQGVWGVVFKIKESEFTHLDEREIGYKRVQLDHGHLLAKLTHGHPVWTYIITTPIYPQSGFPVREEYLSLCKLGAMEHGILSRTNIPSPTILVPH